MVFLFIGAHPDDIELSCSGTICYYLEKGKEVFCYHMTNGVYTDIYGNLIRDNEEVHKTTQKSLTSLGVKKDHIFFTEVNATELIVNKERISELQRFIINNNITTIFTHPDPDTYHQDHRATHNISIASSRRYVNNIFLYENIFTLNSGLITPNFYIDISKFYEKKMEVLRYHKTEYEKYGAEKWINSIMSMAKFRGLQVNTDYAEAFYVIKWLLK